MCPSKLHIYIIIGVIIFSVLGLQCRHCRFNMCPQFGGMTTVAEAWLLQVNWYRWRRLIETGGQRRTRDDAVEQWRECPRER